MLATTPRTTASTVTCCWSATAAGATDWACETSAWDSAASGDFRLENFMMLILMLLLDQWEISPEAQNLQRKRKVGVLFKVGRQQQAVPSGIRVGNDMENRASTTHGRLRPKSPGNHETIHETAMAVAWRDRLFRGDAGLAGRRKAYRGSVECSVCCWTQGEGGRAGATGADITPGR